MRRFLAWMTGLFGCAPPGPVTPPPAPPAPTATTSPALRAVEAQAELLRMQDAARARTEQQIADRLQSIRQYDARQNNDARPPETPRDLDEMVFPRLTARPADAARYLTAFTAKEADDVFARRLGNIAVLLGDDPAGDSRQENLAERVGQLSAVARKDIRAVLTGEARTAITREVLARLRAGRLGADAALRYARAVDDPQRTTLAVLALLAPTPTPATLAHWKTGPAGPGAGPGTGLGFLRDEPLTLAEVEGVLNALVRHGLTDAAKLREERERQTADLLAGRTVKPFQIGLAGTDTAVVEDLAKLLHAPTRDRLQRRLR